MKQIFITGALILALTAMVTSCSSDDDNGPVGDGPSIEIVTPQENAMYTFGDTVFIEIHLEHTEEIGDFHIEMIDQNTDFAVIDNMDQSSQTALSIEGQWVNEVQQHTDFVLRLTATDNLGRVSEEEVTFHCHPEEE